MPFVPQNLKRPNTQMLSEIYVLGIWFLNILAAGLKNFKMLFKMPLRKWGNFCLYQNMKIFSLKFFFMVLFVLKCHIKMILSVDCFDLPKVKIKTICGAFSSLNRGKPHYKRRRKP